MLKIYRFNFLKNLAIFLGSAKKWSVLKRTKTKQIGFPSFFFIVHGFIVRFIVRAENRTKTRN